MDWHDANFYKPYFSLSEHAWECTNDLAELYRYRLSLGNTKGVFEETVGLRSVIRAKYHRG